MTQVSRLAFLIVVLSPVPSRPPSSVVDTVKNSTSVYVSWMLPPKDSRNGLIRGFKLQYNKTNGSFTKTVTLSGNSTLNVTLNKLSIYTQYVYQIWAYTIGDGTASQPEYFSTPEDGEYDDYKVTDETRNTA